MSAQSVITLLVIQALVIAPSDVAAVAGAVEKGQALFRSLGCVACHRVQGEGSNVGPDLHGVYGRVEELTTGERVTVTEEYLQESILNPNAKVVKGFAPGLMPTAYAGLSKDDLASLVAFVKSLPAAPERQPVTAGLVEPPPATVWAWIVIGFVTGTLASLAIYLMSRSLSLKWIALIVVVVLGTTGAGVLWARHPLNRSEKVFTITARQFAYDPPIIRVNKGDRVTIRAESKDVLHGLYIDGYDIDQVLRPGEPARFTFVANKEGKFGFRCSYTCGVLHPFMIGKLIVQPNYLFPGSVGLAIGLAVGTMIFVAKRQEPS